MECAVKDELEQHLPDIRKLAARLDLTPDEKESVARDGRFAIGLLEEHNATGHSGKRCPFATLISSR